MSGQGHRFEHCQSGFTDEFIKIVSHLNEKCKQKSKFEGFFFSHGEINSMVELYFISVYMCGFKVAS